VKNSFFLVIPEQRKDPHLAATFAEPALKQWLAELPAANPGLATRLFQDLVNDLICLELNANTRLTALELLRQQFLTIEDYLRSRLIKYGFPKGEIEKKIFALTMTMEKQFTIGYWMVARELTRREVGWLQSKNIPLAIHRCITGLSSIVITHYMMCYPIPDWIWFDLHSLYKLAVKLGKEKNRVGEQTGLFGRASCVEDAYKQILLLSLTFPSGLMQKEFQLVYDFIDRIGDLVSFEKKPVTEQFVQCVILMDEDLPPHFVDPERMQQDSRSESARMYINLQKLHKITRQEDKYCSKDEVRFSSLDTRKGDQFKLSVELFDYLMQRWQGREPQGTVLFSDRLSRYVAIGLDATHELQDPGKSPSAELEVLAETYSDRALFCRFEKEGVLSIGSLVSFRKTNVPPQQRALGVVCKIQLPKQDDKLIFEISIIAAQSFPVTYLEPSAAAGSDPRRALIYWAKFADEEKSFIILESFMIKDGDILRMNLGQESFPIILMGRKNIGLGYWQFECRRVMENPAQQQENKKGYDFI